MLTPIGYWHRLSANDIDDKPDCTDVDECLIPDKCLYGTSVNRTRGYACKCPPDYELNPASTG